MVENSWEPIEHNHYTRTPCNNCFGAIVTGLDFKDPSTIPNEVKPVIISDTYKYRLLILRHPNLKLSADA